MPQRRACTKTNTLSSHPPPIVHPQHAAQLHLTEATFLDNEAAKGSSGGAVSGESGSEVTAQDCRFSNNEASGGGAMYGAGEETRMFLSSCTLEDNIAVKEGGALRAYSLGVFNAVR